MSYQTIIVNESDHLTSITFDRLPHRNSINCLLLEEINEVINLIENNSDCKLIVLQGQDGLFCTGMDFKEALHRESDKKSNEEIYSALFLKTLKRFTLIPKVVISKVDGQVMAGGIGIVAASDLVIATPGSQFSLSEALWGLLPACVLPFLIRRMGFQPAYKMTLTTLPISAEEAYQNHLVDEINELPDNIIRKLFLRIKCLEESTLSNMKQYFRKLWIINENIENMAVSEISHLIHSPGVKENIKNFVEKQLFPWEKNKE